MSETIEATKHYPFHGYAPGSYLCRCVRCEQQFEGDKRAFQCLPCAEAEERETCRHCRGTGQPNGIKGGPEHGVCSWCLGSGKSPAPPPHPTA